MKRLILVLTAICAGALSWAEERVNLDSLYQVLDRAIDSAQIYLQWKTDELARQKDRLRLATTDNERFEWAKSLYEEYIPFDNDSAIAYQYACLDLADRLGRRDLYARTQLQLAEQLTESGFYNEARMHFEMVDTTAIDSAWRLVLLNSLIHLYNEMGYYSHDPRLTNEFYARKNLLSDSLLSLADSTTALWLQLRTIQLTTNTDSAALAMRYSDRWMEACQPDSRAFATMAFYRAVIFGMLGQTDMQRAWLVRSALIDVRKAIMDQGALWSLAELLVGVDADRAHRYVDFSWRCLQRFSTHMRAWLVAPLVTRINDVYREQLQTANSHLRWAVALVSLLVAGLLALLFYVSKKRRQLAVARNELHEANSRLVDANQRLRQAVALQHDSNRVKDEYLGRFFSMCSEYIDKLDNYRLKMNRKLKANQYNDLLRMTSSEQLKEDEVQELFDHFDTIFLRLFPTFVDDFNALLRPEERIVPKDRNHLNTDLRIFALIRLGISESSRIAEFLRYSPNSIYAYRARIKNKAAGNRDDFERLVKEIGIQELNS